LQGIVNLVKVNFRRAAKQTNPKNLTQS
jgi:hypothetical protein